MRMGIIAYAFNPSIPEVEVGRSLEFCHHSGLLFFDFFLNFMCTSVLLAFVYVPHVCLVSTEVRRSRQNAGNWS